jgi:hypothetical protein
MTNNCGQITRVKPCDSSYIKEKANPLTQKIISFQPNHRDNKIIPQRKTKEQSFF